MRHVHCSNRFLLLLLLAIASTLSEIVIGFTLSSSSSPKHALLKRTCLENSATLEDEATAKVQRRVLGSQELLMLPRQYSPNPDVVFPQMNHVCTAILSATPSKEVLQQAIEETMAAHPLLRCHVEGDGEPDERIDLFQMVRKGEPNPCTFVSSGPQEFSAADVFTVCDVPAGGDRAALDSSWKTTFGTDIDDGGWCSVEKGPLWKVEWHRHEEKSDYPCALVFSFNHAISDQSSANRLIDQIVANVASLEQEGSINPKAVQQGMPDALEDSVHGKNQRFSDVTTSGFSLGTLMYVAGKAAEGFRSPMILPDSEQDATSALSSLSIISGKAAGGEDTGSEDRKSTVQFRTLPADATSALLQKCRECGVSVSNALTAAMTLTATDFIDGGVEKEERERNYKVLQSLDMRRFGEELDKGDTVGCLAGSMDLMHGPFPDRSGEKLRSNPTSEALDEFWTLAASGRTQTNDFISSNGPKHAVRVFDFAMTISDLNNLVYLTAQSKDSQGRAYSAGVTNAGVFERQEAFRREGDAERQLLKSKRGRFTVDDVYFGVSHARSGCLYQLSCLTLGGEMKLTFHPAMPIVSEETNSQFADAFVEILEAVGSN